MCLCVQCAFPSYIERDLLFSSFLIWGGWGVVFSPCCRRRKGTGFWLHHSHWEAAQQQHSRMKGEYCLSCLLWSGSSYFYFYFCPSPNFYLPSNGEIKIKIKNVASSSSFVLKESDLGVLPNVLTLYGVREEHSHRRRGKEMPVRQGESWEMLWGCMGKRERWMNKRRKEQH